ncbi:hypothetical protein [uncultured Chryseobacterium sp.]|uniref:hypothetical protein n=1 Tax=uncultured Chryseobacterium sp. TaxID=259322 RepID=UPI0025FDEA8C|nr:hypothetical protein [uncultured Chryseobacterium sp.]
MKKLYATIGLFLASLLSAQVPQAFSYQTIAFNAAGAPIANGNVSFRISILDNSATGTVLYTETQTKTTNAKGLVNLNIGQGTATNGNFGGINWGTNSKFVKVEMDPAGGSNYTNVGVNQLMSVPYAQVSKTVVTGAGQGITLTAPNGTAYTLGINNSGTLSLPQPTSGNSSLPLNLYFYGSYNSFNPLSAELLRNSNSFKIGYKYFPANTQIKFIAGQTSSSQSYGADTSSYIVPNGDNYVASSNGFYQIKVSQTGSIGNTLLYSGQLTNITPQINFYNGSPASMQPITYYPSVNLFQTYVYGITSGNASSFRIILNGEELGDNLNDGNFDFNGSPIVFPNLTSTPKHFKIEFSINTDGTGEYFLTQL